LLSAAQSAVTKHAALDGAILHLLQWSKTMTRKTYIGTPHRESVSGQSLVTVCDGQKSKPLPLRLDLFNHSPTGFSWGYGGSGPAQLAVALLADALGDDRNPAAPMFQVQGGSVLAGRGTVVDYGRADRGRRQSYRAGGCPNSQ
jgi:hypothetical protein